MENKIQELTDKIYREGVEKGNEEAQKLIAKAQEEAKRIIEDAHKEADSIVATAHKSADELAENTKSELKLFAGQAVNCSEVRNRYVGDGQHCECRCKGICCKQELS